jgi:hypothetical protein
VVGTQVLDLANGSREAHGEIEEKISLVGLSRETGEVANVVCRCLAPCYDDNEGE